MPKKKPDRPPDPPAFDLLGPWAPIPAPVIAPVPMTRAQRQRLAAVEHLRLDGPIDLVYMALALVQCTLPHRNPGDVVSWSRRNGQVALGLAQGVDALTGRKFGYPYGTMPRLLLFWLTTEVVTHKQRRIKLGKSLVDFMKTIGLEPDDSTGKRSSGRTLRNQMERLFRCRISFDSHITRADGASGRAWLDMQVAPKGQLWWDPKQPAQPALWESWIELGEDFFNAILEWPVPVNLDALRALKHSCLGLDLYVWLAHRIHTLHRDGLRTTGPIAWTSVAEQIGSQYKNPDEFRRKALRALANIKRDVYPGLVFSTALRGCLEVRLSPLAVRPRRTE